MRPPDTFRRIGHHIHTRHPVKVVLIGYTCYAALGWILLCLPVSAGAARAYPLDHLFTAISAMSTTGLVTVSTSGAYSLFGELVVLSLIQIGGLGYMTLSSFVVLAGGRHLSEFRLGVSRAAFPLPRDYFQENFIRRVVLFTFVAEAAGAAALYPLFRAAGTEHAPWQAVFHSVSAFCTAGFSLFDTSLEAFAGNFWIQFVVCVLSYLGAIGFIVLADFWDVITEKKPHVTLTSKIVLHATFWMSIAGTVLLFVGEPAFEEMPPAPRLMASVFQAATAMTTVGFDTFPISGISMSSAVLLMFVMLIGASPAGTGGGLKVTTVSALIALLKATLLGRIKTTFWGKEIPLSRLRTAAASASVYMISLAAGVYLLAMLEAKPFEDLVFEAISALGTVGLSRGITAQLSDIGKIVIIVLMFLGRLGPLTFGVALMAPTKNGEEQPEPTRQDLAV